MTTTPQLSIIIPAYNEEKNIKRVIQDTLKLNKAYSLEIIVVDDGSKDDTATTARKAGAHKVISYKNNVGKGGAFRKGIGHARGKFIIQIDADYQFLPSEIPLMISSLNSGYDVVLGTRYQKNSRREEESVNYIRLFGSYFLSFATSIVAGRRITDVMAGFKGFRREVLSAHEIKTNHFGYEAEIVLLAAKKKYKIVNLPITYKRRIAGLSNVNTIRDGYRVLMTIFRVGIFNKVYAGDTKLANA